MAGLCFEQFTVGQKFVHDIRRTMLDVDNLLFSALTYNPAAVHIDHHYAAGTEFGKPLVNSYFTLGLVVGLSIGDTIRAETVVLDKRESKSRPTQGIVTLEHFGINQRDEIVCRTVRAALMLKKPV
jgi:acyl dehydratase